MDLTLLNIARLKAVCPEEVCFTGAAGALPCLLVAANVVRADSKAVETVSTTLPTSTAALTQRRPTA